MNAVEIEEAVSKLASEPFDPKTHIRPYKDGGAHEGRNGLLLRRDIHSLFDAGYVTVTTDLRFEVSRRIRKSSTMAGIIMPFTGRELNLPRTVAKDPIQLA